MADPITHLVIFEIAGVRCGLDRAETGSLLPLARLWRPPVAPPALAGFLNLGGTAVPVVDLGHVLGLREALADPEDRVYWHLILVKNGTMALLVERVMDVLALPASRIEPVAGEDSLNGCVSGEAQIGTSLVHVLAVDRILMAEERQSLAALRREAELRLAEWAAAG